MMTEKILFEICVDSVESAVAAQVGDAQRVELCDNLIEGGTTPSAGMIDIIRREIDIDLNMIIRPRDGDFCYSNLEFEVMRRDIDMANDRGANGIVIGILNPDGSVDMDCTQILIEQSRPLSVTFHRAFDMANDPFQAMDDLIALGIE